MAGYFRETDEGVVNLPYDRPFMIRAKRRWHDTETIASFKTQEEADKWLAQWEAEYKKGPNGHARLWVENWNF